jgi:hypothetical protein
MSCLLVPAGQMQPGPEAGVGAFGTANTRRRTRCISDASYATRGSPRGELPPNPRGGHPISPPEVTSDLNWTSAPMTDGPYIRHRVTRPDGRRFRWSIRLERNAASHFAARARPSTGCVNGWPLTDQEVKFLA